VSLALLVKSCPGALTHSLSVRVVHECVTLLDELLGVPLDLVKVVRGVDDRVVANVNHGEVLLDSLLKLVLQWSAARITT
jgi:hypothetical protein